MKLYLLIAIGGALGSAARFFFPGLITEQVGVTFPWGTLFVNVTGSFVIAFFATLTVPEGRIFVSGQMRQFVMTGFCGGYTTSFSLQTLALAQDEEWARAGGNAVLSLVVCLLAAGLGHIAAGALNHFKPA